ncbi:MAG: AAA family ATPase [Deltaproteobacteria bacterium]|nr:AAA family ATPase [Deltaproteobacteria bacterium]
MRCSNCGNENLHGKKFCEDCGTPLEHRCPKCGAETRPGKRFCGACGAGLNDTADFVQTSSATSAAGERRHLTVLFCDIVGSTQIATQLDPEEWRDVVAGYHRAAADSITRYGGYVAQYLGDGVMAFFGWPEAHENDAECAARAGLAILDALSQLDRKPLNANLSARVGIHSGAVVVGIGLGKQVDVFGDVPSIAARVQSLAQPGTVLITGDTHRLISGLVEIEDCGARSLKGINQPVQILRVIKPKAARARLSTDPKLTPFTGREDELRLLLSRWERARRGEGQVVFVVGEPGIGKSRLVRQFHDRITGHEHCWIESGGDQFAKHTPFYAVSEMMRQGIASSGIDNTDQPLERLSRFLRGAGLNPKQATPLIARLLDLRASENYPPPPAAPEEHRRQLLKLLLHWVIGTAKAHPAIVVLEDLHWADPSTLEFVQLLVQQGASAPLMQIFTARPEFDAPWLSRPHHTHLALHPLSDREACEIVEKIMPDNGLSPEMVTTVVERATGVPLFIEELTRDSIERGTHSTQREIPATLRDSLMARLDRLGRAREFAQMRAVIGREF